MPKSERDEILTTLVCGKAGFSYSFAVLKISLGFGQTSRIFSAMLDELVMDATLQSHLEVTRARSLCTVCNTQ